MSAHDTGNPFAGGIGSQHLQRAKSTTFDLIVVGGGITGCWATLLAAQRGLNVCLVEGGDFGGATSRVSHRILHGGFRYLQSGDLSRLRESVVERRRYFREFPELVRPLPCLMPLYGHGLKRPGAFRAASLTYAALAADQNSGVQPSLRLPLGGVLSAARTRELFELVRPDGLMGAGLWQDGVMHSHPRITMTILRRAAALGAVCLNHTRVAGCRTDASTNRIDGVRVRQEVDRDHEIKAGTVLNCTGVFKGIWPGNTGSDQVVPRAMAFNLMLDRPPVSTHGVAVEPPPTPERPSPRTYFLVPRSGRIAAGTTHLADHSDSDHPQVTADMVRGMLHELNDAVPGLNLTPQDVLRVDAGLIPTASAGDAEPSDRPTVLDHSAQGGPRGLVSAISVKYTTARHTAQRGLRMLFSSASPTPRSAPAVRTEVPLELLLNPGPSVDELRSQSKGVRALCEAEGVSSLADLVLGRTEWGENPHHAARLAEPLADLLGSCFGWDAGRKRLEVESLAHALPGSLPKMGMELTTSGEDSAP